MSTILEALQKSNRSSVKRQGLYSLLLRESPYDRRTVTLEQRLIHKTRRYRWFAYGGCVLAAVLFVAVLYLAIFGRADKFSPAQSAANATPAPTTAAPQTIAPAQSPLNAQPAVVIQVNGAALASTPPPVPAAAKASVEAPKESPAPAAKPATILAPPKKIKTPPPEESESEERPSLAAAEERADRSQYTLQGILSTSGDPMAMVNHRVVRVGDYVNNAKIESIGNNSVTLNAAGEKFTIQQAME